MGSQPRNRAEQRRFRDAVLAFSDDPTPSNLVRYLAASRALEGRARRRKAPAAARPVPATAMNPGLSTSHS
jgi:hypothetical protein